jgi:hypothetical protein
MTVASKIAGPPHVRSIRNGSSRPEPSYSNKRNSVVALHASAEALGARREGCLLVTLYKRMVDEDGPTARAPMIFWPPSNANVVERDGSSIAVVPLSREPRIISLLYWWTSNVQLFAAHIPLPVIIVSRTCIFAKLQYFACPALQPHQHNRAMTHTPTIPTPRCHRPTTWRCPCKGQIP